MDALFSTAFGFEIVVKKRPTMEKNPATRSVKDFHSDGLPPTLPSAEMYTMVAFVPKETP